MNSGILSHLVADLDRNASDAKSKHYEMVNVRPGEKLASMLVLLSRITEKTPSALIADALSERLAVRAAYSPAATASIMEAAERAISEFGTLGEGSALSILEKHGIITVETPSSRKVAELFRKEREAKPE